MIIIKAIITMQIMIKIKQNLYRHKHHLYYARHISVTMNRKQGQDKPKQHLYLTFNKCTASASR